jgi:hypothetical protein
MRAFYSDVDVGDMRRRAREHALVCIRDMPELSVPVEGEMFGPDAQWMVDLLLRMFSSRRLLSMSKAELEALVRGLLCRAGEGGDLSGLFKTGMGMGAVSFLLSGVCLSPLEQVLAAKVGGLFSGLMPLVSNVAGQDAVSVGGLSASWRAALAREARRAPGVGDKSWRVEPEVRHEA